MGLAEIKLADMSKLRKLIDKVKVNESEDGGK
jgi:hypothetical protein